MYLGKKNNLFLQFIAWRTIVFDTFMHLETYLPSYLGGRKDTILAMYF